MQIVNLIGKFFVGVFLCILVLGLVMWGIGDVIKGNGNNTVAKVGNSVVTDAEVQNLVNSQKRILMSRGIQDINADFEAFLRQAALRQLINTKLFENELSNLGIEFDPDFIIKKDFTQDGKVNEEFLKSQINAGGGEEAFIREMLSEKKMQALESSLTSIIPTNDNYLKKIYEHAKQKRNITLVTFNNSLIQRAGAPGNEELNSYFEKNKDKYKDPEYRSVSYIVLDEKSVKKTDKKPMEEILYDAANDLLDKLAEGASLEDTAKELNLEVRKITAINKSGGTKSGNVNLPAIDNFVETVFSLNEGEVSDLLESNDGKIYVVAKVDAVISPRNKALDEVRGVVSEDMIKEITTQKLYMEANQIRESLSNKTSSFEAISGKSGIKITKLNNIERDDKNFSPDFTNLDFVNLFFNKKEGEFTDIFVEGDQIFLARIDKITLPEAPDELELLDTKSKVQDEISEEIMTQYLSYLATKYSISIK